MKLESIKDKKFVLTNDEMGKFVGGDKICVSSGSGVDKIGNNLISYSADTMVYANDKDLLSGIVTDILRYSGSNDAAARDNNCPCK